jgi:hypothetical protein
MVALNCRRVFCLEWVNTNRSHVLEPRMSFFRTKSRARGHCVLLTVLRAGAPIMKLNGKCQTEVNHRRIHTSTSPLPFHIGGLQ